jgi:Tol biopolymer transport system component
VTERVSVDPAGAQANNASSLPALSADGRYVAFMARATNLVPGDTNGALDVFVRDRVAQVTRRVSVGRGGAQANNASSQPALSADGRYVAFTSKANNLVPGDTNGALDVFVRDRITHVTRRVSVGRRGAQAKHASFEPAISADGRYVAFISDAGNLVAGDTIGNRDVFVRDRIAHVTRRVSVGPGGAQANTDCRDPAISASGRYVTFWSAATNLVPGGTVGHEVFVRDRVAHVTRQVSVGPGGVQGNGASLNPAISANGRYVAFSSEADNLVASDTNHVDDVFLRGPLR